MCSRTFSDPPSGRGLHSFTSQLNLSHFCHEIHPNPLIPLLPPKTAPKQPLNAPPMPQKALRLSSKPDEFIRLPVGWLGRGLTGVRGA